MNKILAMSVLGLALSACVSTKTQVVVGDQEYAMSRTMAERAVDFGLERDIVKYVEQINGVENGNHRVAVNAFRGDVLLTGEVPTQAIKTEIEQIAKSIRQVGIVYNYLKVSEPKSQSHTFQEQYMKGKVDAKLLLKQNENITPSQYLVVVRDDWAYIFGTMTVAQQKEIVDTTQSVDGIKGIALLNSLVQVDFTGLTSQVSNMPGDLKTVNPHNRLIPVQHNESAPKTPAQKQESPQSPSNNQQDGVTSPTINNQGTTHKTIAQTSNNAQATATSVSKLSQDIAVFPNIKHTGNNLPKPVQNTASQPLIKTDANPPPQWTDNVPIINPASHQAQPFGYTASPTTGYGQTAPTSYEQPSSYVQMYGTILSP